MFYKYESDFDNDLMFWSNATADLWHKGEIGESDLPDEWDALWAERDLSRSTGPATTVFFVNLASTGRSGS